MFRFQHASITLHVVLVIISTLTLILGAFGVAGYYYASEHEWSEFRQQHRHDSSRFALALSSAVWNMDREQIQQLMLSEMRIPYLHALTVSFARSRLQLVRDGAGRPVAGASSLPPGKLHLLSHPIVYEGETIGSVDLYASPAIVELRNRQLATYLAVAVLALDVAIALALIVSLRALVLNPIRRIGIYANGIVSETAATDQLQKLRFRGELERLKLSLDEMVKQLAARNADLRHLAERFRLVIRKLPIPIILYDNGGALLLINDKFCELYGYGQGDASSLLQLFVQAFPQPQRRQEVQQRWSQYLDAIQQRRLTAAPQFEFTCNGGGVKMVELSGIAIGEMTLVVVHDITDRKQAEYAVEKYRQHLEALVQQRTAELELARDMADSANRAKSVFLANMSHELRTPLNAVIGFSQLMARDSELSEAQRKNLNIINRSGNHLLSLINAVLELSKIEAGAVQLEPDTTNLAALLNETVDMVRVRADQAGLMLKTRYTHLPAYVVADGFKLKQALINLLGNAVKFTLAGEVQLSVDAIEQPAAEHGGQVQLAFAVADTGIGIEPENLARIFEPFVQLETHASQIGTGLGLSISRQFVQLMGGQLTVVSEPGRGSVFRFTLQLPLANDPCGNGAGGSHAGLLAGFTGRILIVDDNAEARILLHGLLQECRGELVDAENGEQAVAAFIAFRPQLVLMDWSMPRLSGLDAIRQIRQLPDGRQARIVVMSAHAFAEQRREALAAGADDFISKPIDSERFYQVLAQLLQLASAAQARPEPLPALQPGDLADLNDTRRNELIQALRELNPEMIAEVVASIGEENPVLAGRLNEMAEKMQYRQLWSLMGIAIAEGS